MSQQSLLSLLIAVKASEVTRNNMRASPPGAASNDLSHDTLFSDLLPSSKPECHFPTEYHGEWYFFERDRSEKVTVTSEHIAFAILGEYVCKSKHWSINYYKLFSVYVNGWCVFLSLHHRALNRTEIWYTETGRSPISHHSYPALYCPSPFNAT